jgi:hypothetical protein
LGGFFTQGGAPPNIVDVDHVAQWDGATYLPLGAGVSVGIHALTVFAGDLVAGGPLTSAGGNPALRIARWNGTSWSDLDGGMDGLVNALTVFDGSLLVGGNFLNAGGLPSQRMARWDDGPVSVPILPAPRTARIEAAPNPFTTEVDIRFEIPEAADAKIRVFDVQGRFIKSLRGSAESPGRARVMWNGRDEADRRVPAGIYFVRVTAPTRSLVAKVSFLP